MLKTCRMVLQKAMNGRSWQSPASAVGTSLSLNHWKQAGLNFLSFSVLPPREKCFWHEAMLGAQKECEEDAGTHSW